MKKMKQSIVIAFPCGNYDPENVYAAVKAGIQALGGMEVFLRPEERVLVKPNLLKPADADSAVTTHQEVLRAVLRLLEEYGCRSVRFGDSPGHDSGIHALEHLGFRPDRPVYDRKKCICCYCCQEMCSQKAIRVSRFGFF